MIFIDTDNDAAFITFMTNSDLINQNRIGLVSKSYIDGSEKKFGFTVLLDRPIRERIYCKVYRLRNLARHMEMFEDFA